MTFRSSLAPAQRVGVRFGPAHRGPAPQGERGGSAERKRVGGDDKRPGAHSDAIRFSRASTLLRASSARIRISTIAPNSREKPSAEASKGQSMEASIVEVPRRKSMLCPWCNVRHQSTE